MRTTFKTKRLFKTLVFGVVTAIVSTFFTTLYFAPVSAEAADSSGFNPGNIIADSVFFNGTAMSTNQVQVFLNSKVSNCRSGYVCLKDYSQSTPSISADSYCRSNYIGSAQESAASIIAKVGIACGISQKVLLVLLQKEQALVTDDWPLSSQYRNATGFSCPDTAPCDPAYSGFFYQVYYAARQFSKYAATPNSWGYKARQNNSILYNPNRACGSSTVYIENQATAGLYIYTPYQPNSAALSNLYGTGDSCSAYGNRNFWRIFTDWFGSTTGTSLVRTAGDPTVYLVSGTRKYPIPSMDLLLSALGPISQIGFVSETYLSSFTTEHPFTRIVRDSQGTIYFIDAGIKLPIPTCELVIDYGGDCTYNGFTQMDDSQLSNYRTGPSLTSVMGISSGERYYISQGVKHEIFDTISAIEAGINTNQNVLTPASLSGIPLGQPIVRDEVIITPRDSSSPFLFADGILYPISFSDSSALASRGIASAKLGADSLGLMSTTSVPWNGTITTQSTPGQRIVSSAGSFSLSNSSPPRSGLSLNVSDAFGNLFVNLGEISEGDFIKSPDSPVVYVVTQNDLRPIKNLDTWFALAGSKSPTFKLVSTSYINSVTKGVTALRPAWLYRNAGEVTVYLLNGLTNKIPITSWDFANEAGITGFSFTADDLLASYEVSTDALKFGVTCGGRKYIGAGGAIHEVSSTYENLYPVGYTELDRFTCQNIPKGLPATKLIRISNGTIYLLENGFKRKIPDMSVFSRIAGNETWLQVSDRLAELIPTGTQL